MQFLDQQKARQELSKKIERDERDRLVSQSRADSPIKYVKTKKVAEVVEYGIPPALLDEISGCPKTVAFLNKNRNKLQKFDRPSIIVEGIATTDLKISVNQKGDIVGRYFFLQSKPACNPIGEFSAGGIFKVLR